MNFLAKFGFDTIGIIVILLLIGGITYLINNYRKEVEKCKKLGDDVFTAPNGSCYRCPEHYTILTNPVAMIDSYDSWNDDYGYKFNFIQQGIDRERLKTNINGIPVCGQIKKSQMDNLGKTTAPAIESASGSKQAEDLGEIYTRANILGHFQVPAERDGKDFSKTDVCIQNYGKKGWVTHDPTTNTCKVCPPGFTKNKDINDYNSSKVCVSKGIFSSEYSNIETHPFNFDQTMTAVISQEGDNIPVIYRRYKCPTGYDRDTNSSILGPKACYKLCPDGTIADAESGACITCPKGYSRTTASITSNKSCKRDCNGIEADGKCYKCPEGYVKDPSKNLDTSEACVIKCPEGSFRIGGKCYQCPVGYSRNKAAVKSDEVCYKACREGTYEDKGLQSCFICPKGYTRNNDRSPVSPDACILDMNRPADLISLKGENGKMKSPEETKRLVEEAQKKLIAERLRKLEEEKAREKV